MLLTELTETNVEEEKKKSNKPTQIAKLAQQTAIAKKVDQHKPLEYTS